MFKFFGAEIGDGDAEVKQQQFERNKDAFYGVNKDYMTMRSKANQSEEDAMKVFFGVEEKQNPAIELGTPIPGYSGFNRRTQADNVFGMTYAEAKRRAQDSQNRIE